MNEKEIKKYEIKEEKLRGKYAKEAFYAFLGCFIWIGDGLFAMYVHSEHLSWGWWFLVAFLFLVGGFFVSVGNEIISIEREKTGMNIYIH